MHNYVLLYDENNCYLFVGMNCECYDRNNPCGLLFIGVTVAEIYPTFSSFMNLSFSISFLEKKVFYGVAFWLRWRKLLINFNWDLKVSSSIMWLSWHVNMNDQRATDFHAEEKSRLSFTTCENSSTWEYWMLFLNFTINLDIKSYRRKNKFTKLCGKWGVKYKKFLK